MGFPETLLINLLDLLFFFNLVRVDSPPLCGEEGKLQSESLGSGAGLLPYPVRLRRGSLIPTDTALTDSGQ
jgi:hypothetical protein